LGWRRRGGKGGGVKEGKRERVGFFPSSVSELSRQKKKKRERKELTQIGRRGGVTGAHPLGQLDVRGFDLLSSRERVGVF
jgi:hypothetical protein